MKNSKCLQVFAIRFLSGRYATPLFWCVGFVLGALSACYAEPAVISLMLCALQSPMSIDGLLAAYFLPLLIGTVLVQTKHYQLLRLLCCVQAFITAYLMRCILLCHPNGFFFLPFLLMPTSCSGILLLWLSIGAQNSETPPLFVPSYLIFSVLAGLDFFAISPFLVSVST